MEEAIKLAKEAGYEYKGDGYWSLPHESYLLDPKFWQALGKALGWVEIDFYCLDYRINNEDILDKFEAHKPQWHFMWHRFIDHLTKGKDVDEFFKDLIK